MKNKTIPFKSFFLFITFLLFLSSFTFINPSESLFFHPKSYQIQASSFLEINGKTNINQFSCSAPNNLIEGNLSYKTEASTGMLNFQNTSLKIEVKKLDCGAKAINKDLCKSLQANDYPYITIDLIQLSNLSCRELIECDEWLDFEVTTDITIVCTSKSILIPLQVKKVNDFSFRIVGFQTIDLCDFGIEPPTALLGLIKVEDVIEINFDLYVDLI